MSGLLRVLLALGGCAADDDRYSCVGLSSCGSSGETVEQVGAGDDTADTTTTTDTHDDGAPATCDDGVFECAWDEGCVDGVCGGCNTADDCYESDGCRDDGTCGACTADDECRADQSCVAGACLPDHIPAWNLTLSAADYANMVAHADQDIWADCTLSADGVDYGTCTARFRGSSTRDFPKKSFRVEFAEGADNPGYSRKIDLRAEYNDPSYLRTWLGLETARRLTALPTPRARFVDLTLTLTGGSPVHQGLMLEVERVGSDFLEHNGRDPDASMYEPTTVDDEGALTPNADPAEYEALYDKDGGVDGDYSDLRELIEDVLYADWLDAEATGTNAATRTQAAVHVDGYLRYLEVMALLQAQDHVTNNFHFSWQSVQGSDAAWEFYPEDMDLTFGCVYDTTNHDAVCDAFRADGWWLNGIYTGTNDGDFELGVTPYWGNLAIHEVLTQTELSDRYADELCAAVDGDFWSTRLPELADGVAAHIRDAVEADDMDLDDTLSDFDAATDEVRSFVGLRRDYLDGALGCP